MSLVRALSQVWVVFTLKSVFGEIFFCFVSPLYFGGISPNEPKHASRKMDFAEISFRHEKKNYFGGTFC
jgi:hypothetical protein